MKYRSINTSALTKKTFRELVRQKGNTFLPDQVAEGLANRKYNLTPEIIEEMAGDISTLVDTLRNWLEEEGIEPIEDGMSAYEKRELMRMANIATLLAYHAFGLFYVEKQIEAAEQAIEEGLTWAKFIGDHRREAFLYEALAAIYSDAFRNSEEIATYKKALEAARRPGDDVEMELLMLNQYVSCLTSRHHFDEAMELIDYGIELGRSGLSSHDQGRYLPILMMNHGRILATRNQRRDAIILLEEGLELALSVDENHDALTAIYFHLGQMYDHLGEQKRALEIHLKTIEIAERNEETLAIVWSYIQLTSIYLRFNQLDLAEKALDVAEATGSESAVGQRGYIYNCRISQLKGQRRFDEALEYGRKLEELLAGEPLSPILAGSNYHIGQIYCMEGDLERGERAYRRAIEIYRALGGPEQPIPIWFALIELLLQKDRLEEAEEAMNEILSSIDEEAMMEKTPAELYDLKGKIAEKKGEMEDALSCTRKSMELLAVHYRKKMEDSLQNARTLADYELYKKEAEIQLLRRKEAEKSLAKALTAFEDKKYALASVESQLRETLALLNETQTRNIVDVLKQAIDNIEGTISRTDTSLHYLQTLDREFFKRLRERLPNLTRKQEHYCGLVRAGLSSKEIASALNLSSEGVRSQRKRVRK
ncbi:MAG: hypothetical protein AB7H80_13420, partial [Candidatus Kapaibacterium sp.]